MRILVTRVLVTMMTLSRCSAAALALILMCCIGEVPAAGDEKNSYGIAVTVEAASQGEELKVCVSSAKRALKVSADSLPWGHPDSLLLVAVPEGKRSEAALVEQRTFIEPGFGPSVEIGITPTCGSVDLAGRFPTIRNELGRGHDVLLFWQFGLPVGSTDRWEAGGYLRISAARVKQ